MSDEKQRSSESVDIRKKEHIEYVDNHTKYSHYIPMSYGTLMGKKLEEHYVADFDELFKLELSTASPSAPVKENRGNFILVNHYVTDFWGYFLEPIDIQVLQIVIRWSYNTGYSTISITEISERCHKDIGTIRKSLKRLEEHFFLLMFQRKHLGKRESKNNKTPIFMKVRDTTPLLSEEQVRALPKFMQVEHEKFLTDMRHSLSEHESSTKYSKTTYVKDFVIKHCATQGIVNRDISFIVKEHGIEAVANTLFKVDNSINDYIKSKIELSIAKPSFDTFIKPSVFMVDGETLILITQDEMVANTLNEGGWLGNVINSLLGDISDMTGINIQDYFAKSFSSYYITNMNRLKF